MLDLLHEEGFLLINDYGQTEVNPADDHEHQRFSRSTAIGVNFALLKAYFADSRQCHWVEPREENQSLHSRLLGHKPAQETVTRFHARFDKSTWEWLREPALRARQLIKVGRWEAAATSYRQALERQPSNWMLMNEVSRFLSFSLRDHKAGIDMAKVALGLNPTSSDLWNTLSDSLFELGRIGESQRAYLRARQLKPNDVLAHYNLAWVYARQGQYRAALQMIAEALALDQAGQYRENLLQKQREVLTRLAQRNQQENLRLANRISTAPVPPRQGNDEAAREAKQQAEQQHEFPSAGLIRGEVLDQTDRIVHLGVGTTYDARDGFDPRTGQARPEGPP